jgi:hypothetical protein
VTHAGWRPPILNIIIRLRSLQYCLYDEKRAKFLAYRAAERFGAVIIVSHMLFESCRVYVNSW